VPQHGHDEDEAEERWERPEHQAARRSHVCFEVEDGASQYQCVDFTKSRSAQTVMPADTAGFTARKLTYTP